MPAPVPAESDRVSGVVRGVVPLALLLATLAALADLAARPLSNFDTFFHLRFGEEFLSGHWSLWHPGHVSTLEHNDWVPTQWLTETVMAQLDRWFGLPGVAWLAGLLFVGYAVVLYLTARSQASLLVVAALIPLALGASANGLSMRPQMISYIASAVTAAAWMRASETGRPPWLLIPLTWLWAMCHGMWPLGVVTGLMVALGVALDRGPRRMLLVPALSLLAGGLTPVGPRLYGAVLLVNSRGKYFTEWAPPRFTSVPCLLLLALLAVALVPMLRGGPSPWSRIALLAAVGGWSVYSQRTVPVAAAMLLPLAAASIQQLVGDRDPATRRERSIVLGGAVAVLVLLACLVPSTADRPPHEPRWVRPALAALPPHTTVVNDELWGGYLMWRYPSLNLVSHGYGDVYTGRELEDLKRLHDLDPGWRSILVRTGARYAFISPREPLAAALRDRNWTAVDASKDVELLRAPADWPEPGAG